MKFKEVFRPHGTFSLSPLKRANNNKELIELWSNFLFKVRNMFWGHAYKVLNIKAAAAAVTILKFVLFSYFFCSWGLQNFPFLLVTVLPARRFPFSIFCSLWKFPCTCIIYITYTANENADKQHSQEIKMSTKKCRKRNFILCCLCVWGRERVARKERKIGTWCLHIQLYSWYTISHELNSRKRGGMRKKSFNIFFLLSFLFCFSSHLHHP